LNRSNQKTSIPFRRDIEGLRALAVGLVIASHAGLPFLRGGCGRWRFFPSFRLSYYKPPDAGDFFVGHSEFHALLCAARTALSDRMCGPDRCYLEVGGQIIYRDADHLTASFSRSLAAVLFQRLRDTEQ